MGNRFGNSALLRYAVENEADTFLVVTESGILHEMQKKAPHKQFIPVPPEDAACACNECNYMKLVTLQKIYNSLKHEWPCIEVDAEVAKKAVVSIERMLEISEKLGL